MNFYNTFPMKKVITDMPKTNISSVSDRQLRIDGIWQTRLGEFWQRFHLTGGYWRLYHHDIPGAGIWKDGEKIELRPDSVYLLPPYPELITWCEQPVNQFYIHFEATPFFGNPECPLNRLELTPELAGLIAEARRRISDDPESGARLDLLGFAIIGIALARLPSDALRELDRDRRITRICDWMRNHPARNLDVPDLAARAGFAPNSFIRRFREVTGDTPHQYLLHLRYTFAARLLESTEFEIDAIASEIGVNDRFHFSRTFRRLYGLPPAAYRKQCGSKGGVSPSLDPPDRQGAGAVTRSAQNSARFMLHMEN